MKITIKKILLGQTFHHCSYTKIVEFIATPKLFLIQPTSEDSPPQKRPLFGDCLVFLLFFTVTLILHVSTLWRILSFRNE